ncbi:MAG: hypothetical protein NTW69_00940 [Chloroflexi bacterium]|nr:hypothetical protein [Chloroflexota bacterium]
MRTSGQMVGKMNAAAWNVDDGVSSCACVVHGRRIPGSCPPLWCQGKNPTRHDWCGQGGILFGLPNFSSSPLSESCNRLPIRNIIELVIGMSAPATQDFTYQHLQMTLPSMSEIESITISFRISPSMNAKLESLAERLSDVPDFQSGTSRKRVSRASIIRECLNIGTNTLIMVANGREIGR